MWRESLRNVRFCRQEVVGKSTQAQNLTSSCIMTYNREEQGIAVGTPRTTPKCKLQLTTRKVETLKGDLNDSAPMAAETPRHSLLRVSSIYVKFMYIKDCEALAEVKSLCLPCISY